MKRMRQLTRLVFAVVATASASGASAVGCSCGTSSPGAGGGDAAGDVGNDVQSDVSADVQADAEPDATQDATQDTSAPPDSSTGTESGADASDAGSTDSMSDAGPMGSDSGDAGDAGAMDGGTDASAAALAFPAQLAAAICDRIAACCGTSGDAATFDWNTCINGYMPTGFKGSNTGATLYDAGDITFDPTSAQNCLNAIAAIDCATNQVTAAQFANLYQVCYAVYQGTLPTGSACANTIQCAPGNYCNGVVCQPLAGDGGLCGVLGNDQATGQTICSYRGSASNGLFCQNVDPADANTQLPTGQWACTPQWAAGSGCWANQDCTSFICHEYSPTDYACATAGAWANSSTCATYAIGGD